MTIRETERNSDNCHKSSVLVEAWETVTVPAGAFETLRIFQEGPNYSVTYWYAPKIGMDVKFESSNI